MTHFETRHLSAGPAVVAPDGSDVRVLLALPTGSMAHFELGAGGVARAIFHRTVEEIWYIIAGRGEMWRQLEGREEVIELEPGTCLTIPAGTHFQFRASESESVAAIGVTMPPWPGHEEAEFVTGPWSPSTAQDSSPD